MHVPISEVQEKLPLKAGIDLVALDAALDELAALDARKAQMRG